MQFSKLLSEVCDEMGLIAIDPKQQNRRKSSFLKKRKKKSLANLSWTQYISLCNPSKHSRTQLKEEIIQAYEISELDQSTIDVLWFKIGHILLYKKFRIKQHSFTNTNGQRKTSNILQHILLLLAHNKEILANELSDITIEWLEIQEEIKKKKQKEENMNYRNTHTHMLSNVETSLTTDSIEKPEITPWGYIPSLVTEFSPATDFPIYCHKIWPEIPAEFSSIQALLLKNSQLCLLLNRDKNLLMAVLTKALDLIAVLFYGLVSYKNVFNVILFVLFL